MMWSWNFTIMRVLRAFSVLMGASLCFLLIQILLSKYLGRHPSSHNAQLLALIHGIKQMSSSMNSQVILVDKVLLKRLLHKPDYGSNSCGFCNTNTISFAVVHKTKSPLTESQVVMNFENFRVQMISEKLPVMDWHNISVPVLQHLFLTRNRAWLHLVVFYEVKGKFLWHGGVSSNLPSPNDVVQYGYNNTQGVFDRFNTRWTEIDGVQFLVPEDISKFLSESEQSKFISCNYTQAEKFFQKYPRNNSGEALYFKAKVGQVIQTGTQAMNSLGIPFWLSSGNCLGWFRQCDVIPYSVDVDFGVFAQHYKPEIIDAFVARGFWLLSIFGRPNDSYELSLVFGGIKLDIFFFYPDGEMVWNAATEHSTGEIFRYYFPKFYLCWSELLSLKVRVPCDALKYVVENYGQNWFEPIKNWLWYESPPNVRRSGFWPKSEWKDVLQMFPPPENEEDYFKNRKKIV